MQTFQIIDERRQHLPVINEDKTLPYHRWEQRAIIGWKGRRFLIFVDNLKCKNYIEEVSASGLEYIEDDSLHTALSRFATEKGFFNIMTPLRKI